MKNATYINPKDPEFEQTITNLKAISGICIFVDICNSTSIKSDNYAVWITLLANTFTAIASSFKLQKSHLVKIIGDEIMIFIPDTELENQSYLTILNDLKSLVTEDFHNKMDNIVLKTKASIHYCENIYNISFHEGFNDYYGKDIDLTSRFMKKSSEDKIIVSKKYYDKIEDKSLLKGVINGIFIEEFKGIQGYSQFYVLDGTFDQR